MLQGTLITETLVNQRTVNWSGIEATFTNHNDVNYDVELTINAKKFLCSYSLGDTGIESFEVLASKGVNVITKKLIMILRATVLHLSYNL